MGERLFSRRSALLPWSVIGLLGVGCDGGFVVENGLPRVTWLAVEPISAERAALTLWVQDPDGDAVDVAITWAAAGATGDLELAPGSPPLLGLPTQLGLGSEDGQAHRVIWNLAGVPDGALTLTLRLDDRPHKGSDGDLYRAQGIDPRVGGGPFAASLVSP
jgi:hypothetical protein